MKKMRTYDIIDYVKPADTVTSLKLTTHRTHGKVRCQFRYNPP